MSRLFQSQFTLNGMKESIHATAPYRMPIDNYVTSQLILGNGNVGIGSGRLFRRGLGWKEGPESLACHFAKSRGTDERT